MNRLLIFNWLLILSLLSGCATVQVSQDYMEGSDFSTYRQYQWKNAPLLETNDVRATNPLLHERFRRNIDQALGSRGFAFGAPADFLVSYSYQIQSRLESDRFGTSVGFGTGRHYRYGEIGYSGGYGVRQYDVGIMVINVHDIPSGTLVWRGTGSDLVETHSTPGELDRFASRLVYSILAQFPPL